MKENKVSFGITDEMTEFFKTLFNFNIIEVKDQRGMELSRVKLNYRTCLLDGSGVITGSSINKKFLISDLCEFFGYQYSMTSATNNATDTTWLYMNVEYRARVSTFFCVKRMVTEHNTDWW
tara:strand:+ start:202 stop:564 length:363 start_codon:yes stop_codon:yes gene_type:complete